MFLCPSYNLHRLLYTHLGVKGGPNFQGRGVVPCLLLLFASSFSHACLLYVHVCAYVVVTAGTVIPSPKSYSLLILVQTCLMYMVAQCLKARRKNRLLLINRINPSSFFCIDLYSLRYDFGDQGADLCTMLDIKR